MTWVCATRTEARAARKAGLRASVVGVGARKTLPDGPLVSFGLAGALRDGIDCGELLDATRVVGAQGETLWEGAPLGIAGARQGTILAGDLLLDDPAERRRLHEETGQTPWTWNPERSRARDGSRAAFARSPTRLRRRSGRFASMVDAEGRLAWSGIARSALRPRDTFGSLSRVRLALRKLGEVSV